MNGTILNEVDLRLYRDINQAGNVFFNVVSYHFLLKIWFYQYRAFYFTAHMSHYGGAQ